MTYPPKELPLFPESNSNSPGDPFFFECSAREDGYRFIAGIDEAGRGPLAGPVVAAAVVLPKGLELAGIRDSKKMTAKAREEAFPMILSRSLAIGIGVVSHKYIDKFNILKASLEAMKRATLVLDPRPDFLLVDGVQKIPLPIPQRCIKKGDQLSLSISAASVLAKVYRDRIMKSYHEKYPVYGFNNNKGYGTRQHLAALKEHGASPLHRFTFKRVS